MYICKECGAEYNTKPDFCDCGNDSFDEVGNIKHEDNKKIKPQFNKSDILSISIFVVCIILSILVLAFFPKIEQKPDLTTKQQSKIVRETNPNIPDIDTFWIKNKPIQQEDTIPVVEQIKEIFQPKPTPKEVKQSVRPVQKKQTQTKDQTIQKPAQTQTVKNQTSQTKSNPINSQVNKKQEQKTVSNPYEFANYKAALGQRLMSNINVMNVKGNGICGVEFTIDSTGKLTNRAFTFQSENKTVNDEVYHALMLTPRYSPPPSSYNGQLIKIVFEFGNGSYRARFTN